MDALKYRKLTVAAVLLALSAAHETRGFTPYLKQTGPAPLRFSNATAVPVSFVLPTALVEPTKPTNATEIAVSAATSPQTNAAPVAPASAPIPNAQSPIASAEMPANPTPKPSASELLVVSPQMLTEFFRPAPEGTNAASTVVVPVTTPVPVGFTPPSLKPPSRATYNNP